MAKPGRGGRAVSPSGSGSSSRSRSPSRSRSFSSSSYPPRSGSSRSRSRSPSPSPSPTVNKKSPAEETKRGRYPPPQSKKSSPPPSTIIFGMSQRQPPSPNNIRRGAANHVRQTIMSVQIGIASVMGILVSSCFSYEISPGEKSLQVGLRVSYATLILASVLSVLEFCGAYIKIFLEDECQPIWNGCWYEWPAFDNLPREWFRCSSKICMGVVVVMLNLGSAAVHLALRLTNTAIAPPIFPLCLAVITFIYKLADYLTQSPEYWVICAQHGRMRARVIGILRGDPHVECPCCHPLVPDLEDEMNVGPSVEHQFLPSFIGVAPK